MKAIRANLTHLYQRREIWFYYLMLGIMTIPLFVFWKKHSFEISMIFSAWIYGLAVLICSHYMEILTKPIGFCLPGYNLVIRKILFLMGFIISIISAVIFALRNTNSYIMLPYSLLIYGSLYMLFWIFGIWAASVIGLLNGLTFFLFIAFGIDYLVDHFPIQQYLFSSYGGIIILLACACCRGLWKRLGRPDMARIYCNQPKFSRLFLSEEKAARKIQKEHNTQIKADEERTVALVEEFFLPKIARSASHPVIPFIWGIIYQSFGRSIIFQLQGGWVALPILVLIISLLGYFFGPFIFMIALPMVWAIGSGYSDLNVHRTLMVKDGRSQRFWSSIIQTVITLLLSVISFIVLVAWMKVIFLYLPENYITIKNSPPELSECLVFLYMILLLFPFIKIGRILFPQRNNLPGFIDLITLVIGFILIGYLSHDMPHKNWILSILLILSWSAFIGALYWTCFHRTLSMQKSKGIQS